MSVELGYVTNEVEGSFWRPHDYMAKVPGVHVIGKEGNEAALNANNVAAIAKFSQEGMAKASLKDADRVVFASEDGVVRRYSFDINADELNLVNITA